MRLGLKKMNLYSKLMFGYILLTGVIFSGLSVSAAHIFKIKANFQKEIPAAVEEIRSSSVLDHLAQDIKYYDEVLTQSARNYVFTQEPRWKVRYEEAVSVLDRKIKWAMELGDSQDRACFRSVDEANMALVEMEEKAIQYVIQGNVTAAAAVLESPEYWKLKTEYNNGLERYIEKQDRLYNDVLALMTSELEKWLISVDRSLDATVVWNTVFLAVILSMVFFLPNRISKYFLKSISSLQEAMQNFNLDHPKTIILDDVHDEMKGLMQNFNELVSKLSRSTVSAQRLNDLLNSMLDAVAIIDADTAVVLEANDRAWRQFGYRKGEIIGKTITEIGFAITDLQTWQGLMTKLNGSPNILIDSKFRSGFRKEEVFVEINMAFVRHGSRASRAVLAVIRNISERKQREKELTVLQRDLRLSQEGFSNIVEKSTDSILVTDAEGVIVYANPVATRSFGHLASDSIEGQYFGIPSKNGEHNEVVITRAGGEIGVGEYYIVDTKWNSKKAYLTVIRDVTDRRMAQEKLARNHEFIKQKEVTTSKMYDDVIRTKALLEQSNRELDAFAYTISHDLRAPLRHIIRFSQMVQDDNKGKLSRRSSEDLDRVVKSGENIDQMMEAILQFSRIGRKESKKSLEDMRTLVEDTLRLIETDIKNSCAKVTLQGDFPKLRCHKERVVQVFLNLVGNSLKYVPSGKAPEVIIGCKKRGGKHWFFVKDNGIGIKKDDQSKIFNVFSRLHAESSGYEGIGIGLSNVKKIIDLHYGEIYIESEENQGAVFWFSLEGCQKIKLKKSSTGKKALPKTQPDDVIQNRQAGGRAPSAIEGFGSEPAVARGVPCLLVVDDCLNEIELLKRTIQADLGDVEMRYVTNGEEALNYIHGKGPYSDRARYPECDLVLLDINMPGLGGFEALRRIKEDGRYNTLPIVVIYTSSTFPDDLKRAFRLGAADYIVKSASPEEVLKKIRSKIDQAMSLKYNKEAA